MFLLLLMPKKLALGKVAIYLLAALRVSSQENEHWQFFFLPVLVRLMETLYISQHSHMQIV